VRTRVCSGLVHCCVLHFRATAATYVPAQALLQVGIVLPGITAPTTTAYSSKPPAVAAAAALSPRSSGRKKKGTTAFETAYYETPADSAKRTRAGSATSSSASGRKSRGKQKSKRDDYDSDGEYGGGDDYPGAEEYDEPYDDEHDTSPAKDEQGMCWRCVLNTDVDLLL
jgi:hypothetical protein